MGADELKVQLTQANRILVDHGVLDAFGHVSARDPEHPGRFLLSRNRAPGLVEPDDIMAFELDGTPLDDDRPPYLERFIHGAVYRARPEVGAVVHSHAPSVLPFTIAAEPLRPVMHMAGFLGAGATRFDLRDLRGDGTDLLIRDARTAQVMAAKMGSATVLLMRGHGFVTAAASLQLAVFQAIYVPINAEVLAEGLRLGPVVHLTLAEAIAAGSANASQVDRAWQIWRSRIAPSFPLASGDE